MPNDDNYSPYQNEAPKEAGILGAALGFAKNMAIFGIANMVGRVVTRGASRGIANFIAKSTNGRFSEIAKSVSAKGGTVSIGSVFAGTQRGQKFTQNYSRVTQKFRDSLAVRDEAVKRARALGPAAGASARIGSAFTDLRTFSGTVGRAWKRNVLYGSGVEYAIDVGAGVTKDMGLEKKPIWDVGGQVGNFAKWMSVNTIYGLGFQGIPALSKAVGAQGAFALRDSLKRNDSFVQSMMQNLSKVSPGTPGGPEAAKFFNVNGNIPRSEYGKSFIEKAFRAKLGFQDKVISSLRTVESAVRQTGESIKSAVKDNEPIIRSVRKNVGGPYKNALEDIKRIWAKRRNAKVKNWTDIDNEGGRAVEYLYAEAGSGLNVNHKQTNSGMGSAHQVLNKLDTRKTLLEEILPGLSPIRNKNILRDDVRRRIDAFVGTTKNANVESFRDAVYNMRTSRNAYTGYGVKGAGVDLSFLDPLRIARRTTAILAGIPIGVPFSGLNFSIGSLLHLDKTLQEKPRVALFEKPPDLHLINKRQFRGNQRSLYVDGKFINFQGGTFQSIEWGRKLDYAPKSGAFRDNEVIRMNKDRHLNAVKEEANKRSAEHTPIKNWNQFLGFMHSRLDTSLPTAMTDLFSAVRRTLSGKKDYVAAAKLFGMNVDSIDHKTWKKTHPVIGSIREHASQEMLPVIKSYRFHELLGDSSAARLGLGDRHEMFDIMNSDLSMASKITNIEKYFKANSKAKMSNDMADAIKEIKAFPEKSSLHPQVKPLGRLSSMTAYDKVRIGLIDDIFKHSLIDDSGVPGARDLLLVKAAKTMRDEGLITRNAEKAVKFHSVISQFEQGLDDHAHKHTGITRREHTKRLLDAANDTAKSIGLDLESDLIRYIGDTKMRRPPKPWNHKDGLYVRETKTNTPYVSTPGNFPEAAMEYGDAVFNTVGKLLASTLPFKRDKYKHFGMGGTLKYLASSTMKLAAVNLALKTADSLVAMNPLLDDTALEDGLVPFFADQAAKVRLGSSRVFDTLGLTGAAKYLHGLMPGFESSAPGAIAGAALSWRFGGGAVGVMKGLIGGGLINRIAAPYLPNLTKSYEELQAEYSGETQVPMMKNPSWLLGLTPWEGSKVIGWKPNWYVEAKSRWKESDTLYGSTARKLLHEPLWPLGISIGDVVDPYYMERKQYFSRPFPTTGGFGDEIPVIGPIVSSTIGKLIKPQKTMHQEFLEGGPEGMDSASSPFAIAPPSLRQGLGMMAHTSNSRSIGGMSANFGTFEYSNQKNWAAIAGEDFLYNVQNFTGLAGFVGGAINDRMNTGPTVIPTLETAGRMASQSRAFYDMNLGGLGALTEAIRRMIPKPPGDRLNVNPIPNMFPNWLPSEFMTGDAYSKILKGELRLPGSAFEKTHTNIRKSMPARGSMLGYDVKRSVQYFTGMMTPKLKEEMEILETGTFIHKKIQDALVAEGIALQIEPTVYDVKNDISGHIDAIIKDGLGGGGKRALEIKSISGQGFNKLKKAKWEHISQLNFYLKSLKMDRGSLLYVNRDDPSEVKTFEVRYDPRRYYRDIDKIKKAREIAGKLIDEGVNDKFGYSYSWVDRLKILADVAPGSQEFKDAKSIVQKQISANLLSETEVQKYELALKHKQARIRQYELFPRRFSNKIFSPDTEVNIDSINEDIKAGAEYALPWRAVGAAWENFTNMNTVITNKFFAFKDPLDHYKTFKLYGKEFTPWDEPYRSFIEPMQKKALSRTDPISAALTWGISGSAFGGPVAGAVGGALGAMYGSVQGLRRILGKAPYIPEEVTTMRNIEDYFDKLKYSRSMMMSDMTEGITRQEYIDAGNSTMTAFLNGSENVANLFRGVSGTEKPYLSSWLNVTDEDERNRILEYVSPSTAAALKQQWGKSDKGETTDRFVKNSSDPANRQRLNFDRRLMDPSMVFEDIKMKTVEDLGYDAHSFNLGWNDQVVRMQQNYNEINSAATKGTLESFSTQEVSLNSAHVRQSLITALKAFSPNVRAQVYVHNDNEGNFVNITVRRDRSRTVFDALEKYTKYRES